MSKTYRKGTVPRDAASVPQFLDAELWKLERSFADAQPSNTLQWLTAEPAKLYAGMEVLADGTTWNPGWGRGKYIRDPDNGSWVFIGGDMVGAGAAVTQTVDKTTDVTLNAPTGEITLAAGSIAAGAIARFTFNNSFIGRWDQVRVQRNQAGSGGAYNCWSDFIGSTGGSCIINVKNESSGALNEQPVISFRVIKGDA